MLVCCGWLRAGKGLTWHALSEAILAHKPPEASPAFATYNEMKSLLSAVGGLLSQYFTAEPSDTTLLMEIARRTYTRILVEGRPLGLAEDTFLHILRMLQNLDRTVQIIPDLTRTVGNIVTYVDRLPLYRDLILRYVLCLHDLCAVGVLVLLRSALRLISFSRILCYTGWLVLASSTRRSC